MFFHIILTRDNVVQAKEAYQIDSLKVPIYLRDHYINRSHRAALRSLSQEARASADERQLLRTRRQKTTSSLQPRQPGPFEPFYKSPSLNNNAVTRESIRKMRSANFVSKFLVLRSSICFFGATIVCSSLDLCSPRVGALSVVCSVSRRLIAERLN